MGPKAVPKRRTSPPPSAPCPGSGPAHARAWPVAARLPPETRSRPRLKWRRWSAILAEQGRNEPRDTGQEGGRRAMEVPAGSATMTFAPGLWPAGRVVRSGAG